MPTPRPLKVYGGHLWVNHRQVRGIVAARTLKQARELTGVTAHEWRNHWCETGNATELAVAANAGGVEGVWYKPGPSHLSATPADYLPYQLPQ